MNNLSDKELELIKYVFNLNKEIIPKLNKYYLKIWEAKYLDSQVVQEILDTYPPYIKNFYFKDSGIIYTIHQLNPKVTSKKYGISFRAIDNFQGYAIIKPWRE